MADGKTGRSASARRAEQSFMLQIIIDLGEISLFGHPVGLRILECVLMVLFGLTLGIIGSRVMARAPARAVSVAFPVCWLGVLVVVAGYFRPVTLPSYMYALTIAPGALAGLLLARWPRLWRTPATDGAIGACVVVATMGYWVYGVSVPLRIYGYGLMLVLGFLVGICLARWLARRLGEDPDAVTNLALVALVGGFVGARLAYIIEQWSKFSQSGNPLREIFNITSGGLIYYGGVALAMALALVYLSAKRLPIRRHLDILAPSLMVGLAFGRMGCLLSGCCFGGPCAGHFPLAMRFPYASRPLVPLDRKANVFGGTGVSPAFSRQVGLPREQGGIETESLPRWLLRRDEGGQLIRATEGPAVGRPVLKSPGELTHARALQAAELWSTPVHPAQVYGVVSALLIAGLLLWFTRLRRREGQVFLLMIISYPVTRFLLESIRGDNPHDLLALRLTHNQYISIGMVALGLILWHGLRRLDAAAGPWWSQRLAEMKAQKTIASRQRKGKS